MANKRQLHLPPHTYITKMLVLSLFNTTYNDLQYQLSKQPSCPRLIDLPSYYPSPRLYGSTAPHSRGICKTFIKTKYELTKLPMIFFIVSTVAVSYQYVQALSITAKSSATNSKFFQASMKPFLISTTRVNCLQRSQNSEFLRLSRRCHSGKK